mmetsp:Transcript_2900/g.18142  ORF Transcript_2900/g.18142 Transcript_2900/m.18142 type:complete len:321 (+) Transcript_2900:2054-3016(+)
MATWNVPWKSSASEAWRRPGRKRTGTPPKARWPCTWTPVVGMPRWSRSTPRRISQPGRTPCKIWQEKLHVPLLHPRQDRWTSRTRRRGHVQETSVRCRTPSPKPKRRFERTCNGAGHTSCRRIRLVRRSARTCTTRSDVTSVARRRWWCWKRRTTFTCRRTWKRWRLGPIAWPCTWWPCVHVTWTSHTSRTSKCIRRSRSWRHSFRTQASHLPWWRRSSRVACASFTRSTACCSSVTCWTIDSRSRKPCPRPWAWTVRVSRWFRSSVTTQGKVCRARLSHTHTRWHLPRAERDLRHRATDRPRMVREPSVPVSETGSAPG